MVSRKRTREELESSEPPNDGGLLDQLRNMWEFSCLMQYIFIFGKAVKIDDDFDVEDLETECLRPEPSEKLQEIGLKLLKWISSHRGLTYEIWDEYTRRQYLAKAPHLNPYGAAEEPKHFIDFDVFQKIRVLHQLSVWTFWNPDRLREKMPEQREGEQVQWRVEEVGYDKYDRQYYVLDDNRLYRRTEPALPSPPAARPKANTVKARAARRRARKRARLEDSETPEANPEHQDVEQNGDAVEQHPGWTDTFGGFKWECIAVTLPEYKEFLSSLEKSKDPDEKILRDNLIDNVLPVIEKAEEAQRRKIERKEKELLVMRKMAGAKRSSRLADKQEKERHEREAAEAERKRTEDLRAAQRDQERQQKMDMDRESRMMTREQRIKDREYKRILREEELTKMEEEAKKVELGALRGSERHLRAQMDKTKKDLQELEDEDDWTFDCSACGVHGVNLDDGTAIISCEKCNVWQHMKCLGISKSEAAKTGFTFLCRDCKRREEDAKRPKIAPLKFRVGTSSSPPDKVGAENKRKSDHASDGSPLREKMKWVEIPHAAQQPPLQAPIAKGRPYPSPAANGASPLQPWPASSKAHSPSKSRSPPQFDRTLQSRPGQTTPSTTIKASQQLSPYMNGARQAASSRVQQTPPPLGASSSFQHYSPQSFQANGTYPRPLSQGRQIHPTPQYYASKSDLPRLPSSQSSGSQPAVNGTTAHPRSSSAHSTSTTPTTKLPSPVQNRPSMSPTQGNPDVGPLAGFDSRPPGSPYVPIDVDQHSDAAQAQQLRPHAPTKEHAHHSRPLSIEEPQHPPAQAPKTPIPFFHDHQQQLAPKSGLSPTKQSPDQSSIAPAHVPKVRTVSGTPVFPPTETLQPSPEAVRLSPVPTPMKDSNATAP